MMFVGFAAIVSILSCCTSTASPLITLEMLEPSTTLGILEPNRTLGILEPNTTLGILEPNTTVVELEPSTTVVELEPSTTVNKLGPSTTVVKLEPNTTVDKTVVKLEPNTSSLDSLNNNDFELELESINFSMNASLYNNDDDDTINYRCTWRWDASLQGYTLYLQTLTWCSFDEIHRRMIRLTNLPPINRSHEQRRRGRGHVRCRQSGSRPIDKIVCLSDKILLVIKLLSYMYRAIVLMAYVGVPVVNNWKCVIYLCRLSNTPLPTICGLCLLVYKLEPITSVDKLESSATVCNIESSVTVDKLESKTVSIDPSSTAGISYTRQKSRSIISRGMYRLLYFLFCIVLFIQSVNAADSGTPASASVIQAAVGVAAAVSMSPAPVTSPLDDRASKKRRFNEKGPGITADELSNRKFSGVPIDWNEKDKYHPTCVKLWTAYLSFRNVYISMCPIEGSTFHEVHPELPWNMPHDPHGISSDELHDIESSKFSEQWTSPSKCNPH